MAKNKKLILGCVAAVLVLAALVGVWFAFAKGVSPGNKSVIIEVVNKAGETATYNVRTDAEYLRDVMEEADGLTFVEENGMVMSVNGERADYVADKAYWAFYIGDAYCNYGINEQPVADGDVFRIVYTAA
ncbi:MAG: DUF4430 domain-containing protein [Clostridia bacterium]|nr:DUF4430 domain-containing protein [Clostridia bacterium]